MPDSPELAAAKQAAAAAADVIRYYYGRGVAVREKSDHTPVTDADVESEKKIREILLNAFPDYGFYGEETGHTGEDAEVFWLVDPIDGTKSFVRRYPFFSTQIALMDRDGLKVGVSSAPLFSQLAWAERDQGAWLNDNRLIVSDITLIRHATLSSGNLKSLAKSEAWGRYGELVAEVDRIRGYGDFYHYHLLAEGAIDVVLESDVNILDIAALALIVEEAGGRFTDLHGAPVGLETRSVLAANPSLHAEVLSRLDY